ncbi:MAG: diguanylate cyclase [Methyloceanibacter sp.]|uniref:diguanylate cyclase n=1 Tax=Methyloceanibacter sp. TaxID=1965321 RepID=UPI003D6D2173
MRIALVDPFHEAQESTLSLLGAQGHEIIAFTDADEALMRIEADAGIDALIASAPPSPAAAKQLCREARQLAGDNRTLYVLLMSPRGLADMSLALDCGADSVIDAPPATDELCQKLRVAERMLTLERELARAATIDQLSGLMSRAAFLDTVTFACREVGTRDVLSVVAIDIDNFRAINDHYGHVLGDQAIREVADVVGASGAPAGRIGGDEFAVLLKGYDLAAAVAAAEELHRRLADVKLETADWTIRVTCSLGVGELRTGDTVDDLIKRADLALYRAKQEGRDRVATTPTDSWMSRRPRLGVSLARLLTTPSPNVKDRRKGAPPGPALYARIFAIVDLLIASGASDEAAAQLITQRLALAGIPAPKEGESDWWREVLDRRAAFRAGDATDDALKEYQNVVAAIESIAPHERVECALANDLWDRRRMVASKRPSARGVAMH